VNNTTYLVLAGIIVIGGVWNYFRTGGGDPTKIVNNINSDEMFKAVTQNPDAQIIDARTPGEYASGKILNATNIDYLNASYLSELEELDKSKQYYVYCKSGQRSKSMGKQMKVMGFASVYNLSGGIMSWNKPLEK
jgi:rhodanese-related sulfurtransferase